MRYATVWALGVLAGILLIAIVQGTGKPVSEAQGFKHFHREISRDNGSSAEIIINYAQPIFTDGFFLDIKSYRMAVLVILEVPGGAEVDDLFLVLRGGESVPISDQILRRQGQRIVGYGHFYAKSTDIVEDIAYLNWSEKPSDDR